MKRVLVVGAGSYIGESFTKYVYGRLDVTTVGTLHGEWRKMIFSDFDSIVHVAGIAHRKQNGKDKDSYFAVNRDLAISVAQKAKSEGVRQFVFFSSLYAYGVKSGEITKYTVPAPQKNDYYSFSKYEAEKLLEPMQTIDFHVAIIRPPMVYGPNCKGNFPQLVKIARLMPLIPKFDNRRSMIFIDNLAELLAIVIDEGSSGILCPQNKEYVSTMKMIKEVAKISGKKLYQLSLLNLIRLSLPIYPSLQSAFGNLYYNLEVSKMPFEQDYQLVGFEESIKRSVSA